MHNLGSEVPEASQPQPVASQASRERERNATDHLYWARSSSHNAAPPPKAISAEEAKKMAESSSSAGGSAWNQGGSTWEEKKISEWCHQTLKTDLLPQIAYELPSASGTLPKPVGDEVMGATSVKARVVSAEAKGDCIYVLSRGKQRVVFELELKLELEVEVFAEDEMKTILTGKLTVPEVTNDEMSDAKLPSSKCTCEQVLAEPSMCPRASIHRMHMCMPCTHMQHAHVHDVCACMPCCVRVPPTCCQRGP